MPNVIVVATGRKTRGGITSVLKAFETTPMWSKFNCYWIQTHRDGNSLVKIIYFFFSLLNYIFRLPFYHIIHVHFSLQTSTKRKLLFVKIAKFFRKKVIAHLHCGSQIDDIWNKDYEYLFSVADISLFLSKNLKENVEKHTGKKESYEVCYNPCPIIVNDKSYAKTNTILFSGTLYKGKGYADLIKAFAKIAHQFPSWKLVFAGNGEIEQGLSLADELDIKDQVIFLGWVSGEEKDKSFKEASIFCLPSYAEGFPMAVLDAWAYGLPVITTPVGGIPDVAKDGENMLLFNPGDIDTLAKQLVKLILNEELRNRISKESINFADNLFNISSITKNLEFIYRKISDNNRN